MTRPSVWKSQILVDTAGGSTGSAINGDCGASFVDIPLTLMASTAVSRSCIGTDLNVSYALGRDSDGSNIPSGHSQGVSCAKANIRRFSHSRLCPGVACRVCFRAVVGVVDFKL